MKLEIICSYPYRCHWDKSSVPGRLAPKIDNARRGMSTARSAGPGFVLRAFGEQDWVDLMKYCDAELRDDYAKDEAVSSVFTRSRREARRKMDAFCALCFGDDPPWAGEVATAALGGGGGGSRSTGGGWAGGAGGGGHQGGGSGGWRSRPREGGGHEGSRDGFGGGGRANTGWRAGEGQGGGGQYGRIAGRVLNEEAVKNPGSIVGFRPSSVLPASDAKRQKTQVGVATKA